ncbi:MAG: hypothetical protein AAB353_06275 [Candidatus Hydrogenedentota bacterium]
MTVPTLHVCDYQLDFLESVLVNEFPCGLLTSRDDIPNATLQMKFSCFGESVYYVIVCSSHAVIVGMSPREEIV